VCDLETLLSLYLLFIVVVLHVCPSSFLLPQFFCCCCCTVSLSTTHQFVTMNGLEMISNYTNLISSLERQELESSLHGDASPPVYGQLLAIYLLTNDL